VILHVNHLQQGLSAPASALVAALLTLVEDGRFDGRLLAALRVHLDWIQYRANFREPVSVRRATDPGGRLLSLAEIAVDLRRADPATFAATLADALGTMAPFAAPATTAVEIQPFTALRESIIWRFNNLFWQRVSDWEAATGRGFENALPTGRSDANDGGSVADSVADFWTLLVDLEKRAQLPAEIFALEIGVGSGTRAALWLDRFKALDAERSTGFYPRLRFLLGDYSMPTLDRALAAVAGHGSNCVSVIALDALNPLKTLAFLRYKMLYVHLTNVYDNLACDELVRRDGRYYLVEGRAYVPGAAAAAIEATHGIAPAALAPRIARLLEGGPEAVGDRARGVAFWRDVWDALRLEERLVALDDLAQAPMPPGLDQHHLDDMLKEAPDDVRFHLSRGAAESFLNTLPLLHPRGYLQVQDIFVTSMEEYRHGFRGPGKLDGSVVNWVNGPLLRAVAARAGYDVHFAPFRYRAGSKTSILYTTQRE
jgi:hypothetical protein